MRARARPRESRIPVREEKKKKRKVKIEGKDRAGGNERREDEGETDRNMLRPRIITANA